MAYFRNFFRSELIGSPFDTPLTANQNVTKAARECWPA